MIAPVRISTRNQAQPIVDEERRSTTEFHRWLNSILSQFAYVLNQITALPIIQQALMDLDAATQAALAAAQQATDAAMASQASTDANAREAALQASYIDPSSVLTADTTTITIANHTRHYATSPETTVAVTGGTIAATASGDTDYIFYDDPDRLGGTVTYQVSTVQPIQTGSRHVVGAVKIPATGTASGGDGPRPPGAVYARNEIIP